MKTRVFLISLLILIVGAIGLATSRLAVLQLGKQPDGAYIVSTGRRIEPGAIAFEGRPIDLALHPTGGFIAVLNKQNVFLSNREGIIAGSSVPLSSGAGYHGALWTPDGNRLYVSVSDGNVQELRLDGQKLTAGAKIWAAPPNEKNNPRPGGMAMTHDGGTLFVAAADRNAVAEINLSTNQWVREFKTENIPFDVKLSVDEKTLVVSNWGGRVPKKARDSEDGKEDEKGEALAESVNALVVVDPRGVGSSGTVSLIDRAAGAQKNLEVGLHPTAILMDGNLAYAANAASDNVSVIDVSTAKIVQTIPLKWGSMNLFGSMPCSLAIRGKTLFVCNGGDNALCEISLPDGKVRGYRPAGYYPVAVAITPDGKTAFVLNTKGNGSTARLGKHNAHDFQGTVSVLDLTVDLTKATAQVAADNAWDRDRAALRPKLAVYNGAIQHVIYIIKENRTYDEVFGDMPQGNGDPSLCGLGAQITPNAHALATQFTLFDNGYVSGTNSADGHAWSTQALANDYLEHNYTGYRTYPDDGDDPMGLASSGMLWDAALKKGKTIRIYGEFCDDALATFEPRATKFVDYWKDRQSGANRIQAQVSTRVAGIKKYIHPHYVYWPLIQSDQHRADIFIDEYQKFSREDRVPNLMVLSLPSDHTEGRDPDYPKPQSMVADNDLALGRIVEAVSKSKEWKNTCIFVIEDDAQAGPDHVDGHRTVYMALSPYTRRGFVDSSLYTTISMLRSIELMLGLDPMNRFDALTPPLTACFSDTPDLTPYQSVPNRVALGDMNPPKSAQTGKERYWTERSLALDWSGLDRADPEVLNRVLWHTLHGVDTPYPTK